MARVQSHSHTSHACHTHAWLNLKSCQKGVCCTCIIPLHLAFSISCLTHPCCSLTVTSRPFLTLTSTRSCRIYLSKRAGHRHLRTSSEKFGYLAKSAFSTGYEPKKFDKITSVDSDTMLVDDPDLNEISDSSKNTHTREHWTVRCSHNVWTLCFARFSRWFCSSNRKQRKHASGNRLLDRGRKEREGSVISVVKSMSKKNRRNSVRSHSLQTLRKFFSDGWHLRENLQRRAQQAILGENSDQRRLYLTQYNMEIQNLERRNSEHARFESQRELESQRRHLLKANQWADQAQRESIHLWSRLGLKDHLHKESYARSCREIQELKRRCYQEENSEKQEEFPAQHDQESRTVSPFFYDPDLLSSNDVPTFFIKLLLPRVQESLAAKLECCEIHERIWRFLETFSNVSMLNEILMIYTMIQEIWRYHWRLREQKDLRIVGAKNYCNQCIYLVFQ